MQKVHIRSYERFIYKICQLYRVTFYLHIFPALDLKRKKNFTEITLIAQ